MSRPAKKAAAPPVHTPAPAGRFEIIPLNRIKPSRTNPRKTFDEAKLEELAASVREKGVLEPVLVRPTRKLTIEPPLPSFTPWHVCNESSRISGPLKNEEEAKQWISENEQFELIAGERRYRAAKLAGLTSIPAISREYGDKDALEIQVIENLQRQDLSAMEEAEGYELLLKKHGYTAESLSEKIGKSRAYVYGKLKLCNLPAFARQMLEMGILHQSVAQLIARIPNPDLREVAAKEVCDDGPMGEGMMSFRDAKNYIESEFSVELKSAPFSKKDANLLPIAGACVVCPNMSGNNRDEFPDGRADVCNDPSCYKLKVEAHAAALLVAAGAKGLKILSKKESDNLFPTYQGTRLNSSTYIDLAAQCYDDAKNRSYKQLLGDQVEPVVAQDRDGAIHYLVPKTEAAKALKAAGILSPSSSTSSSGSSSRNSAAEKKHREEDKRKLAARAGAVNEALAHIAKEAEKQSPDKNPVIRLITSYMARQISTMYIDTAKTILARCGIEAPEKKGPYHTYKDYAGGFQILIDSLTDQQCGGLLAELMAVRSLDSYGKYVNSILGDDAKPLLDYFGVDLAAITKRIDGELKAKAEKKQPGAKKAAKDKQA